MTCWYLLSLFLPPVVLLFVSVGSDFWTEAEKSLFSAALETYGKEFSLIQKMVRTHFLVWFFFEQEVLCIKSLYAVNGDIMWILLKKNKTKQTKNALYNLQSRC